MCTDACVDVIVTDMPFGNLCGSRRTNQKMYPRALKQFHRVLRADGRCALLTAERKMILRLLQQSAGCWLLVRELRVHMSGLPCSVFILHRLQPPPVPLDALTSAAAAVTSPALTREQ